ncbi:MAG: 1-deoxy-D-xylulose-5-phosphate synthase [Syntrophales bacterium]|nr:1-deoxy-D-xylulose-5-phosphate synthase [Syntrophales bacterium]MCK9527692.1 1-deoxy-D-xylulose-5-phosphate synthase [Syntrophales bacterium]MDX9921653.1 1-deoxy-D-xylulose-5-phosphate synthase [Syntrophales bacterium]
MTEKTFSILEKIETPEDIRKLKIEDIAFLAEDIRRLIIGTVASNGGHLAPSLGAVELTLALHYVFDTPKDRIIWDVGHQSYAHKIITGRKNEFSTLRKLGGIAPFPKRDESPYDVFGVGHSSTSISAGSGIVEARGLTGKDFKVVCVIGDGSMTAGLAFEGLNWAGDREQDLIIVLNDNEMSISPNVGALSSYLNRIMTGQHVVKLRAGILSFLKTIPGIGEQMVRITKQAEESLKAFIVPGVLFEEMGFQYVGPLEGHRVDHLIKNFVNIKTLKGPVLVHVVTRKGKGYAPAEAEPSRFHGVGPFDVATGEPLPGPSGPPAYTDIFGRTMVRLARENPKIVAITAAMSQGTGLEAFAGALPERFFDVGIAEPHGVTFAAGLAVEGIIPVVAIYSTFLQRAYDQVLHDVCLQKLPVVFALDRGGIVGDDGATHQGVFDLSSLRSIPNIVVMAPKDENELQHMMKTAIELGGPVSIRYPRGKGEGVPLDEDLKTLEIGRGELLRRGKDAAIVAIGSTVYPSLEAAWLLAERGIDVSVVNSRFVKPLDEKLVCEVAADTGRVVTVEENVLMGGFGSAVLELYQERGCMPAVMKRLGIPDRFIEHGTQKELRERCGIDAGGIAAAVEAMMDRTVT